MTFSNPTFRRNGSQKIWERAAALTSPLRSFESISCRSIAKGNCLAAKLRLGNVPSAEGWKELLLPEIERQQRLGEKVVFLADAAFAKTAPLRLSALSTRTVFLEIGVADGNHLRAG